MDFENPVVVALAVAVLTALLNWAYAKYVIRDPAATKVLAKTLGAGAVAAVAVVLYIRQHEPVPSLQADPFFAPIA
jgi:hypothetical protein